jgi:replicative DNA helicase
MNDKEMPNVIEAEKSLLGSCLMDNSIIPLVQQSLKGEHFYSAKHRAIWDMVERCFKRDKIVSTISIDEEMDRCGSRERAGGIAYVAELEEYADRSHAPYHVALIKEKARARSIISACWEIQEQLYTTSLGPDIAEAETKVLRALRADVTGESKSMKDMVKSALEFVEKLSTGEALEGCIPYPWKTLEKQMSSMKPGHLIYVAGRPSMGKSSFGIQVAIESAMKGFRVLFYSLEVSHSDIGFNALCSKALVNAHFARQRKMTDKEYSDIAIAAGKLSDIPFCVDDRARGMAEICARARLAHERDKVGLIMIDYLQLIRDERHKGESREQQVSGMSHDLKGLAADLQIPVMVMSQLNRLSEARPGNRPQLSDLRESGSLEQDADEVLLIHRPSYYTKDKNDNSAEIIIAKQRNGPQGLLHFTFIPERQRFEESSNRVEEIEERDSTGGG